ncbi:MAG: hypothetical protein GY866_26415, partial [Proteobacteria bacterium]|nr:hypothetical protein [Pseudomonadota bacterium]
TFSVQWKPEEQGYSAFHVPSMEKGFEAQRYIIQSGWTPPVMRQYDAPEAKRHFPEQFRGDEAFLIMVHEGPKGKVAAEIEECTEIARDMGCEEASVEAVKKWMVERNHVASIEGFLKKGIVVDTIEVASTWDKIGPIYRAAVASLNLGEKVLSASAHSSHCYRSGLNLYFS